MLRRRDKFLEEGYNCIIYQDGVEETMEHLFFNRPSAMIGAWIALGILWDEDSIIQYKIYIVIQQFNQPFFMEIFMIGAWTRWNEKNDYIFNHKPPSFVSWKSSFKVEVRDHFIRIERELHHPINHWLDAL
jgi:hypothetical protein